ncbi:His-Xaa-Ser system radical SAM maturase HxsB [Sphingomonas sp. Root710]|uniref:His-Xaa-Ser system radical SAM maturase HxsB n=1 Tax=Sphingomonas sp. Root710 TaxID=1736594 RepID=UPI0006FE4D5D|nr:His-Xaa-Ser system radical SAM maturase HxsB [Sphingomonas sp. Root710]KRB86533.1 His-Xaa-Ser system radical SAM maturase HxsB [Sphingomonas sp. Root710]
MTAVSLRARAGADGRALYIDTAGRFFRSDEALLDRWRQDALVETERAALVERGVVIELEGGLSHLAALYGEARRSSSVERLDYLILVPTLRCNLSCSYCQVSRADERAQGYDWSDATLEAVLTLLRGLDTPSIKIEFQGGEPTLRLDLIEAVIAACDRFERADFVICTNLATLDEATLQLLGRKNLHVSTSLDGPMNIHQRQRTLTSIATDTFAANLATIIECYGPDKVSALPTIDPRDPPAIDSLIDAFVERGLHQIFLRPINYQGFARKRHSHARDVEQAWLSYQTQFMRALIVRNWADRSRVLEESYFSIILRRIFQPGHDRHVDLRNPNTVGTDYIVVDYDGAVYPTDEARMLTRSGVIDLRIGDVINGWDSEARKVINAHCDNRDDPTCAACAYQPYCGRDVIDDLARYGTIDLPREETAFCQRHLSLFDLAFDLIYDPDPAVQYSLRRWLKVRGDNIVLGDEL